MNDRNLFSAALLAGAFFIVTASASAAGSMFGLPTAQVREVGNPQAAPAPVVQARVTVGQAECEGRARTLATWTANAGMVPAHLLTNALFQGGTVFVGTPRGRSPQDVRMMRAKGFFGAATAEPILISVDRLEAHPDHDEIVGALRSVVHVVRNSGQAEKLGDCQDMRDRLETNVRHWEHVLQVLQGRIVGGVSE